MSDVKPKFTRRKKSSIKEKIEDTGLPLKIDCPNETSKQITSSIRSLFSEEDINLWLGQNRLLAYQNNPVEFWTRELGQHITEDIERMMNSVRDNRITICISANATGKSFGSAGVALWFYKCFNNAQVFVAAAPPESNLKNILWSKISHQIANKPKLFQSEIINDLQITRAAEWNNKLKTDSFIAGLTIPTQGTEATREAKFSGKHAENLLFILDEGDAIPDECYRGIESCMSGGHARMLIMFNPRRPSGKVYQMIKKGIGNVVEMSAFNHPNVVTGKNLIPGAVTRDTTVKRLNEMSVPLMPSEIPDDNCFELPHFLEGVSAVDGKGNKFPPLPPGYRRVIEGCSELYYMVLGRYPSRGSNQLIPERYINEARSRWDMWVAQNGYEPPKLVRPIIGHDIADTGEDSNCICLRYGGWIAPLKKWKGVNVDASVDKCANIAKEHNALYVNADSTGVGASAAPKLKKMGIRAYRIMMQESPTKELIEPGNKQNKNALIFPYRMRDQILWSVREWLMNDLSSTLPPDERLLDQLGVLDYKEDEMTGRIKVMSKEKIVEILQYSPDELMALALTFAPPNKKVPNIRFL